ncbi:type IV pilus biogenesis/stability protein PilW [Luteimonas sp. WGS1318]|uniref:type IV pilus biogenesis/stability protein PilW n=1 Tax=Luteimonas sp. WGS1318 TaxID=3366815 RepID=UPI00372D472E
MRLRDAALVLILLPALFGCSRLDFVKPSGKSNLRVDPPSYNTRGTPEARRADEARQQIALASRELDAGNDANAERAARQALRVPGTAADANTILAMVQERRGRREQAGAFYRAATEHAPEQGAYLNNYGAWLCGNGRAAESLAYFDAAMRDARYGDTAGALANAGACALDAGQPGRAEPDLRAALELDPVSPVALDAMARLLAGQGRHFEARAFSQRRLAAGPATAAALQLAARIEQGLGDSNAAERYLQRLRTDFPSSQNLQPREASPP